MLNQDDGIDLVKYGALWQKVQDMDKKMDKMENQIEQLLELANKGRGGLWSGMSVIAAFSTIIGYLLNYFKS